MKIARIELSHHRLRLDPPFVAAWDSRPREHFDLSLVRVTTDEGLTGVGAGDAMPGFAGHEHLFLEHNPLDMERHFRVIENLSFHYGRCWPLDIALWDLAGKIHDQPVWRLLGAASGRVRCYASSGVLRAKREMLEMARSFVDAGFPAMKVRFHRASIDEDLAVLETLRENLGESIEIMVDCNQGWRMPWDTLPPWTFKQALNVARALEDLDAYWMEEPLHRGDYVGMAALREATDLRVAGGEMTRELHEFRELIARGCLDVLQPDCALSGGITGLSRIAAMARAHNLLFTPHTWGHGIQVMANAHLMAGAVGEEAFLEYPFDPPEWSPERRDFGLAVPIETDSEGYLALSEAPGLGIELDEDLLARTQM
ncbi:MAG: mandelate racemase/muconate lactonizing enzyme family protein [Rhodovibrionaceae bacterium]|nr:mandelate racemase/muconate lactonizing enzyme family protein [Rhodovibrionaceae bacterium]